MSAALRRSLVRYGSSGVLATALLAACGGGEILAIIQIVTPLAGNWSDSNNDESINFTSPDEDAQVFASELNVTANVSSEIGVCGASGDTVAVAGRLESGQLTLRRPGESAACLEGRFVDLRRFDAVANGAVSARSYLNTRVDVRMGAGVWVSDNGQVRLKFEEPSTVNNNGASDVDGCDVSNPSTPISFSGIMSGFNTNTLARPGISELRGNGNNALLFSAVDYVDGDTITLRNAANEGLTLTRKNEQASCP